MNGYYQRTIDLPLKELMPLKFDELEFISDLNEPVKSRDDPRLKRCPRCGCQLNIIEVDTHCPDCHWNSIEN